MGKFVEGVWHTSVVVYGYEYTYGNDGVHAMEVPVSKFKKEIFHFALHSLNSYNWTKCLSYTRHD